MPFLILESPPRTLTTFDKQLLDWCSSTSLLAVEYVASAEDGVGRLYARQFSAQRVPRSLRLAAYGLGHQEVDMTGAHYEIVRRSIEGCTLPPIKQLRALLREECRQTAMSATMLSKSDRYTSSMVAYRQPKGCYSGSNSSPPLLSMPLRMS